MLRVLSVLVAGPFTSAPVFYRFGGKRGVRGAENVECGKCKVWKMRSVENFNFPFQFPEKCGETVC